MDRLPSTTCGFPQTFIYNRNSSVKFWQVFKDFTMAISQGCHLTIIIFFPILTSLGTMASSSQGK